MNRLAKTLLATAFLVPLMGASGVASERGCSQTRNGLLVPMNTGSLMVDGVLLGDSPGEDQMGPDQVNEVIADLDILHAWVGCLEVQRDGKTIGVRLLSVITKGGAAGVMRSHLEGLVRAQEVYHTAAGAYAHTVAELHFLASHPSPPINVVIADGQWTATMLLGRDETQCVASAVLHIDRSTPPEVSANCQVLSS